MNITNMVATVSIVKENGEQVEFNLRALEDGLSEYAETRVDESHPIGLYLMNDKLEKKVTVKSGGKLLIRRESEEGVVDSFERVRGYFHDLIPQSENWSFELDVNNVVVQDSLEEENLNLNAMYYEWMDNAEYEPEQFPALIYRFSEGSKTVLLYGSGELILSGAESISDAREGVDVFKGMCDDFHSLTW